MSAYPYPSPYEYNPALYPAPRYPAAQRPPQAHQAAGEANTQGGFICRPVTSRAAAEVAQIPFDGSTAWFYDTAADVMYAKTFHFADGTAPIVTYVREAPAPPVRYATLEELNDLREEIERLRRPGKAGRKNEPEPNE